MLDKASDRSSLEERVVSFLEIQLTQL
jgi:hypothetical protein